MDKKKFYKLTQMLPIGYSEVPENINQSDYTRLEVRTLLSNVFIALEAEEEGKQSQKLHNICKKFINTHEISCGETIYQCDWVVLNALEFIEEICNEVGYFEYQTEGK